jgi:hypothetical protein
MHQQMPAASTRWHGVSSGKVVVTAVSMFRATVICIMIQSSPSHDRPCGKTRTRHLHTLAVRPKDTGARVSQLIPQIEWAVFLPIEVVVGK